MISTLKRIQARKVAQGVDGGFTLIELLIVIVVLGILAAVVVFSLGSVTTTSAVSACQADGATVETAIAAYNAQTTSGTLATSTLLVPNYIASFPNNTTHYQMAIYLGVLYVAEPSTGQLSGSTGPGAGPTSGTIYTATTSAPLSSTLWNAWVGATTCNSPVTVK